MQVEWLKAEWRRRGLLKRVQRTFSGCLGPCDVPSVVLVAKPDGLEWLGGIERHDQYEIILNWATRSKEAGMARALQT